MAVTSKNLRSQQQARPQKVESHNRMHILAYAATLLLVVAALYSIVGVIVGKGQIAIDDLRYGRPRTFQIDGFVGHSEVAGIPSHFIAINQNRQIIVLEIPGGDPTKVRAIQGPYLFGANEDLTPVTLDLRDMDGDGQKDLLVNVRREQIVYLNRDGAFRLPTPAEQAILKSRNTP